MKDLFLKNCSRRYERRNIKFFEKFYMNGFQCNDMKQFFIQFNIHVEKIDFFFTTMKSIWNLKRINRLMNIQIFFEISAILSILSYQFYFEIHRVFDWCIYFNPGFPEVKRNTFILYHFLLDSVSIKRYNRFEFS